MNCIVGPIAFLAIFCTLQWIFGAIMWYTNKVMKEEIFPYSGKADPKKGNIYVFLSILFWSILIALLN